MRKIFSIAVVALVYGLSSCDKDADPGPLQPDERQYPIQNFNRLELGSALVITVEESPDFFVETRGDRRNLDDLEVFRDGQRLVMRARRHVTRHHPTYVTIGMPDLRGADFSGASEAVVKGFDTDELDLTVSGASVAQFEVNASTVNLVVSGASFITLTGEGDRIDADLSGASVVHTYGFEAASVTVNASGGSQARVLARDELTANTSGASVVYYRGDPSVTSTSSGGGGVVAD